jgi:hypothetical protein
MFEDDSSPAFVGGPTKATISRVAADPPWTFFANALKADRNHRFIRSISFYDLQEFSFYAGQISFNAGSHTGANRNLTRISS